MTDLHTHILPGMDDGPADAAAAAELLEQQLQQGVHQVALTSHYLCEAEPLEAFLARRDLAFAQLRAVVPSEIALKAGCEVYYSPELMNIDARKLCLEGTNILLLELPILQKPVFLPQLLAALREQGITVLIAHVERYAYVSKDPTVLAHWISLGALIQVNADGVTGFQAGFVRRLIKWGLVHVLASDAHNALYRPPNLRQALDAVRRSLGDDRAEELEHNAALLFSGQRIPQPRIHIPKKVLGFWV